MNEEKQDKEYLTPINWAWDQAGEEKTTFQKTLRHINPDGEKHGY